MVSEAQVIEMQNDRDIMRKLCSQLKCRPWEVKEKVAALDSEIARLESEIAKYNA